MKQVFLLSLLSISLVGAQAQNKKAYAVTADVKGSYNWVAVKEIDLATGEVTRTLYDPTVNTPFKLRSIDGQLKGTAGNAETPTFSGVAAAAFDERNNRIYFTNMRGTELRYFDLNSQEVTVVINNDATFNTGSKADEANVITRMVIGADGFGYALTNDGRNLIRFSTDKKAVITNLGALKDDSRNGAVSIHNLCTSWGGDMVADAYGNLIIFSMRGYVFRVNPNTRVADHLGTIEGLPANFTVNGAAVDAEGHVVVSSSALTDHYFRVNLGTMKAIAIPKAGDNVWNASDLASSNIAYKGGLNTLPAIAEVRGNEEISIYPNPVATRFVNVAFEKVTPGKYTVELTDASGRKVINYVAAVNGVQNQKINLPKSMTSGMYLVRVINADGKAVFNDKIVVQ